jgi:SSS family solute:Na+ symporter
MSIYFLVVYLIILAFIAYFSFKKIRNYSDFFIARKKGSYIAITGSLIATILGGSAVIGSVDAGSNMGWTTSWFMLCASIGLLGLLPLVKKINKIGRFTLPELLEDLYGKKPKDISSVIIPVAWLGIIAAQVIAAAKILTSFIEISYTASVLIAGIVFITYTIAGGQVSILKTDAFQSVLILLGLILISSMAYFYEPAFHVRQFDFPFNADFTPFSLFLLIITYSTTFTAGPDIYSRIFSAKNEKTAKHAIITTAAILIPIAFIIGYLSVLGESLNYSTTTGGAKLINIGLIVLPEWLLPLVILALLSAVLSSADTSMLSASIIITDLFEKNNFSIASILKTRIVIALLGVISIVIALNFSSIIGMLLMALTVYSGAFTLPIIMGLAGFKTDSKYVSIAIFSGGVIALAGKIIAESADEFTGNMIIIMAFVVNAVFMFIGNRTFRLKH